MLRSLALSTALGAAALGAGAGSAFGAEAFYGVTQSDRVISFNSDSPRAIRTSAPIAGLLANERVLAIDVRPRTNQLYALGSASRLYTLDPATGVARAITPGLIATVFEGGSVGFDADPAADVLRVTTVEGQNVRIDPATGQVVDGREATTDLDPDSPLSWAPGDVGAGTQPRVGALAHTSAAEGPIAYGLDSARDSIVRLEEPQAAGVLRTLGPLGIDAEEPAGLDVARDGSLWAAFRRRGSRDAGLWRIDRSNGKAYRSVKRNAIATFAGRRRDPVLALAHAGRVADDRSPPTLVFAATRGITLRGLLRGGALRLVASCDEACTVSARLRLRGRTVGTGSAAVRERPGAVAVGVRLTRRGRKVVRRNPRGKLRLRVSARDAAGNLTRTGR